MSKQVIESQVMAHAVKKNEDGKELESFRGHSGQGRPPRKVESE